MTSQEYALILPLISPNHTLATSGGKGLNLARLTQAGFPVPDGFVITSAAYQHFVEQNHLKNLINKELSGLSDTLEALESASQRIRATFSSGLLSDDIRSRVLASYRELKNPRVAVRSSATAEDLPELSFAGQQDTYLNITNEGDLLKRVVDCWSSLWTARAIGYRMRQHVPQEEIALAVVVQELVESEVSGVMFTANPLTGLRSEVVIDAAPGLGEGLVSGLVEPDHYVFDSRSNKILSKTIGAKRTSIRPVKHGGTVQIEELATGQALSDEQILELAALGIKVQELYDFPQDIEWAVNQGRLFLLQSRPITSLFPIPEGYPPEPLQVFGSFASVQGIFDPITPLGRSVMQTVGAKARNFFGMPSTEETQRIMVSAGERLWSNVTGLILNPLGRKVIPIAMEFVEPALAQAFKKIWDDPRLQPERTKLTLRGRLQLARLLLPLAGNVLLNLLFPKPRRKYIIGRGERVLKSVAHRSSIAQGDRYEKLGSKARMVTAVSERYFAHTIILFMSGIASGMASWNALNRLTRGSVDGKNGQEGWGDLILQVSRGMPNNPTIEMDLQLWEMTKSIKQDPESLRAVSMASPKELADSYLSGKLPDEAGEQVSRFLEIYGGRGYGEIDLGHPRWADDPTHVFEVLQSFLQITDMSKAPDEIFNRGVIAAQQAVDELTAAVRHQKGGFLRAKLVRFFAGRARLLLGMRENPKFFAVRLLRLLQVGIREVGGEFVNSSELDCAEDLFFLSFTELFAFSRKEPRDWHKLIRERRVIYQREFNRRQLPRLLLSDGRAFYEGMATPAGAGEGIITGSPVSPGVVEGVVRVVLDPRSAGLKPGEIMVCPGTDPSWTPLFMAAGGLVMEMGGMMTHGAVVAREYGIPAVVGVHQATVRFKNGQRISLNGSSGEITLLDG